MDEDTGIGANEGKDEKNLSLEERVMKAIEEIKRDENGNILENPFVEIGGSNFELEIDEDKENRNMKIHLLGVHILTLDENNELNFVEGWKENLTKNLEKTNSQAFDKEALIQELEEMEKTMNKRKELQKAENSNSNPEEKEEEEKDKEDKPELDEEEDKDEMKEEIARQYNVNARNVIRLAKDEKVTDKRFEGVVSWAKGYDDIYVIQGEDDKYSCKFVGMKEGQQEEIDNKEKQIGGKNPDITIKKVDNEQITEVKPLAMYEVDSTTSIAVIKDEHGRPELLYCRQEGGDEKKYWGMVVPEDSGKNVLQKGPEERALLNSKINSKEDLSGKARELEEAEEAEKRGIPTDEEGVQAYEIAGNDEQNRQLRKEKIKEDLYKRMGIAEKMQGAMPGYDDYMEKKIDGRAEKIMRLMDEDASLHYEEAVKRVEKEEERAEGGRTPDQGPRKRGM